VAGMTALNASLSQTFFKDRLGFELVYDQQSYNNGQIGNMGGPNYAISVDVMETYADGSYNPNFGRPYVADSDAYGNNSATINRNSLRFTTTAELRASDFLDKSSWIARILGHHTLTFLDEEDHKREQDISWEQYATTSAWEEQNDIALNSSIAEYRQYDWVTYIGPNLLGQSSAAGTNLGAIGFIMSPGSESVVRNYNATWNSTTVSPTAPYNYIDPTTGTLDISPRAPIRPTMWAGRAPRSAGSTPTTSRTSRAWSPAGRRPPTRTPPKASRGRAACLTMSSYRPSAGARIMWSTTRPRPRAVIQHVCRHGLRPGSHNPP